MDQNVVEAARRAFPGAAGTVTLGAVAHGGEVHPEPIVSIPLSMTNRLAPPSSRMGPLMPDELRQRLSASAQVRKYAEDLDRESAREILQARAEDAAASDADRREDDSRDHRDHDRDDGRRSGGGRRREEPGLLTQILRSPVARSVATQVTRGLMGALLGTGSRRRRR